MSYSQNDEETQILSLFDGATHGGRFLDIGAWDGRALSNTCRLAELGWSGVMVEPSPFCFPQLYLHHGSNQKILLVNAAIGETADLMEWWDSGGDAVSTLVSEHKDRWEAGSQVRYKRFLIPVITLHTLLGTVVPNFNFINLDVESLNLTLFRILLPLVANTCVSVICVEHDGRVDEILDIARIAGFQKHSENGENLIIKR